MKFKLHYKLLSLLALLVYTSCERVVDEPKSKLIIEYPSYQSKMGAISSVPPREVFIVLSNPDRSNARQIRIEPTSNSIEIEVAKGVTQVLQVLAIYPGSFDSSEVFHGSVEFTADQDEVLISLHLQNLGSVVSGYLAGRVISPLMDITGVISAQFQIRPDLAPIEVQRDLIIGGWFHTLGIMMTGANSSLAPIGIIYQVQTPSGAISLFGSPKQLDEFLPSPSVAQVFVPRHQIQYTNGIHPKEPKAYVLGFWSLGNATGLISRTIYNEASVSSLPIPSIIKPLKVNSSTSQLVDQVLSFGFSINSYANRGDLIGYLLSLPNTSSSGFLTGSQQILHAGGSASNLPCIDSNKFDSCLELRKDHWDTDRQFPIVGDFRGAFRFKRGSGIQCATLDSTCSGFILPNESSLSLLPGVTVSRVRMFYLPNSSLSQNKGSRTLNQISCTHSSLQSRGFIELPEAQIISGSQINVPKTNLESDAATLAICGNFNGQELLIPVFMSREELGLAPLTN